MFFPLYQLAGKSTRFGALSAAWQLFPVTLGHCHCACALFLKNPDNVLSFSSFVHVLMCSMLKELFWCKCNNLNSFLSKCQSLTIVLHNQAHHLHISLINLYQASLLHLTFVLGLSQYCFHNGFHFTALISIVLNRILNCITKLPTTY